MATAHETPGSGSLARILREAMDLFATYGFHGVTTRRIAAAVGLNIATVHHHAGTKSELYRRVFHAMQEEEKALLDDFMAALDRVLVSDAVPLRDLLLNAVDSVLAMFAANPARPRLYMRRWLEPDEELAVKEAAYSLELFERLSRALERAQEAGHLRRDADIRMLLRSLDWMIYGYFVAGPVEQKAWRGDPHRPENIERFRCYLHAYVCRMLGMEADCGRKHSGKK
jgi:AcrR family transcriptional regulator